MKKTQISIWATDDELSLIDAIKEHYQRNTYADTLRFLIVQESQKILSKTISKEIPVKPR